MKNFKIIYLIAAALFMGGCSTTTVQAKVELIDINAMPEYNVNNRKNAFASQKAIMILYLAKGEGALTYLDALAPDRPGTGEVYDDIDILKQDLHTTGTTEEELILMAGRTLHALDMVKANIQIALTGSPDQELIAGARRYLDECNEGMKLAKYIQTAAGEEDTRFGGFIENSVYVLEPSSKEYKELLNSTKFATHPVTSLHVKAVAGKNILIVQENPGQWTIRQVATDASTLANNIQYIADKALVAAVKYSGLPVDLSKDVTTGEGNNISAPNSAEPGNTDEGGSATTGPVTVEPPVSISNHEESIMNLRFAE